MRFCPVAPVPAAGHHVGQAIAPHEVPLPGSWPTVGSILFAATVATCPGNSRAFRSAVSQAVRFALVSTDTMRCIVSDGAWFGRRVHQLRDTAKPGAHQNSLGLFGSTTSAGRFERSREHESRGQSSGFS